MTCFSCSLIYGDTDDADYWQYDPEWNPGLGLCFSCWESMCYHCQGAGTLANGQDCPLCGTTGWKKE